MIIEFSEEFDGFTIADWGHYLPSVMNLIDAFTNGWHLVVMSRSVAQSLGEHQGLSNRHRAVLRNFIYERAATYIGQARSAPTTLCCVVEMDGALPARENQILIPLESFSEPESCQKSRLLVENALLDGIYLKSVATHFAREHGYMQELAVELDHGGGGSTPALFRHRLEEVRPLVCVVDSDQTMPGGNQGVIANQVMATVNECAQPYVECHVLPVRMIENTIPLSFFYEVYNGNQEVLERIDRYDDLLNLDWYRALDCELLNFINLKSGELVRNINARDEPFRTHVKRAAEHVSRQPVDLDADPEIQACQGIAHDAMSSLLSYLGSSPWCWKGFMQKLRRSPIWDEFVSILSSIFSFGINAGRLPV